MAFVNPVNEIATNLTGLRLVRILNDNTLLLQKSLERLTSGLRIINAGDDPAGAATAVKLKSQITRLDAVEETLGNTSDYIQSQSDFLSSVSTKLSRLSELANLSENSSTTADQRSSYQIEFAQIQAFISDIGGRTFNNLNLFGVSMTAIIDQDATQFTLSSITYNNSFATGGINDVFVGTVSVATTTAAVAAQSSVSTAIANLGILTARASSNADYITDSSALLVNLEENLQASLDRIQNTDMTTEMVEFNRLDLLTSTGATMLANWSNLRLNLLDLISVV